MDDPFEGDHISGPIPADSSCDSPSLVATLPAISPRPPWVGGDGLYSGAAVNFASPVIRRHPVDPAEGELAVYPSYIEGPENMMFSGAG